MIPAARGESGLPLTLAYQSIAINLAHQEKPGLDISRPSHPNSL